jgi:hypothetical protein
VGSLELVFDVGVGVGIGVGMRVLKNKKIEAGDGGLLLVFENMQQKQEMEH